MIRIAVCDDNSDFLKIAVSMIEKWSEQRSIATQIFCFDNGDDLIAKNSVLPYGYYYFRHNYAIIKWYADRQGNSAE